MRGSRNSYESQVFFLRFDILWGRCWSPDSGLVSKLMEFLSNPFSVFSTRVLAKYVSAIPCSLWALSLWTFQPSARDLLRIINSVLTNSKEIGLFCWQSYVSSVLRKLQPADRQPPEKRDEDGRINLLSLSVIAKCGISVCLSTNLSLPGAHHLFATRNAILRSESAKEWYCVSAIELESFLEW